LSSAISRTVALCGIIRPGDKASVFILIRCKTLTDLL
jgi:hypothetical protein